MEILLRVLSSVLSVYMLLIFIRILLTWFSGATYGKPLDVLKRVTDPYLNIFRRVSFLRTERIDFSPIAAIISLVIVLNIINTLRIYGEISLGIILALVISALWSAVFFLLFFFGIIIVVRLVSLFGRGFTVNPFWQTIDVLINPVLTSIQRIFFRGRQISYRASLGSGAVVLIGTALVGRLLVNLLIRLLRDLPI
jgi:YggT family protein